MNQIKKISIKKFGIFDDFQWDNEVRDKAGNVLPLKNINIIYGRNYSGKTTLSRILKSFRDKKLPEKYKFPEFEIILEDNSVLTQDDLESSTISTLVYNEDFILKKFRFFVDPNGSIEPFAIMGENVKLQEEIDELKSKLGNSEEGNETALYKKLKEKKEKKEGINNQLDSKKRELDELLRKKATDREIGIKYKSEKFSDINYNKKKLKNDIETVRKKDFDPISNEKKEELEKLIREEPKSEVRFLRKIKIDFQEMKEKTKDLVERKVLRTDKIEELVKDTMLNNWVEEGKKLHEERQLETCAFCGNPISESRWQELEKHFDEASKHLKNEIKEQTDKLDHIIEDISNGFDIDINLFYPNFSEKLEKLVEKYKKKSNLVINQLIKLRQQLETRMNDIINEKHFEKVENYTDELDELFNEYN